MGMYRTRTKGLCLTIGHLHLWGETVVSSSYVVSLVKWPGRGQPRTMLDVGDGCFALDIWRLSCREPTKTPLLTYRNCSYFLCSSELCLLDRRERGCLQRLWFSLRHWMYQVQVTEGQRFEGCDFQILINLFIYSTNIHAFCQSAGIIACLLASGRPDFSLSSRPHC